MARITKSAAERRREFITTAQQLFYSKGYESTSVNDIVKEIGVAKGTFYHHFDSKMAVLQAMVDELLNQQVALLHDIIADETVSAIPKWQKAFQLTGNWKMAHKDELITVLRLMRRDENMRLLNTIRTTAKEMVAPEIGKIIAQGVEEGVFAVEIVEDTAVIVLAITESFSNTFGDLVLNSDGYDNPIEIAQRKLKATQTAVERVLNAPSGSLPIIEPETVAAWFKQAQVNGSQP